jgi:hypothetical protein
MPRTLVPRDDNSVIRSLVNAKREIRRACRTAVTNVTALQSRGNRNAIEKT